MAVSVARRAMFSVSNSSRINHFGRKPVIGGRPPREVSVSIMIIVSGGESVQVVPIVLIVFVFCDIRVINIVVVIRI